MNTIFEVLVNVEKRAEVKRDLNNGIRTIPGVLKIVGTVN